jgi:glucose-6-phosphate isomerase
MTTPLVVDGADSRSRMAATRTAMPRFADWVGGRYSLWGPVGLPIMLAVGADRFRELLAGGAAMDRHFCDADLERNLPVLLALTGIWHRNICGYPTRAVLPYDQRLSRLPAYLQQLDMESNGKRVSSDGVPLTRASGPIVWGEPGTNGQHAFFQLLHQGTDIVPAEFLISAQAHEPDLQEHHELLKANCLAQSEALMIGRSFEQAMEIAGRLGFEGDEQERQAAHRTFPGNRPSVTLAYPKLTPFTLGQIIAIYEHRVFVEGVIWGINSFDQWGVELGKELANALLPLVKGADAGAKDASTRALVAKLRSGR